MIADLQVITARDGEDRTAALPCRAGTGRDGTDSMPRAEADPAHGAAFTRIAVAEHPQNGLRLHRGAQRRRPDVAHDGDADDGDMSSSDPHLSSGEPSALELFFAMAAAFMVVLVAILVGFLLPVAIGVGVVFATLAVVLAAFGAYIARVLSS